MTTIKWRFHFIRGRFHYSGSIKCCQKYMIQNSISSETHNWYVCATWEIEPKKSRFNTDDFPGRSGRSKYFAYLGTYMLFVDQPVVSLSFSHRANQWLLELEWDGQQHLTAPIWKCVPGIDHRFTFFMYLLSNYTFYTNLTIFSISRLPSAAPKYNIKCTLAHPKSSSSPFPCRLYHSRRSYFVHTQIYSIKLSYQPANWAHTNSHLYESMVILSVVLNFALLLCISTGL